ncbi:hypothetical protein FRZ67_06395 [Panacibacter ginsenosidivorans]|uniref:Uncharacterized protein n=1 Tax=Panacibacter ginsenosidivorans TaxID=1813871 RepID=A0A5B8V726_9BACT|nr:hypothetical protein [Panacibacter ginsenosidivorans]QEC66945.1 hypothetical protein FRZ67_06395 [Panacibacter ginsenosidivorans]
MTREELWKENIENYLELIDKYKWDQEPIIELINKLENYGLCKTFYPSNSHESLVLSMFNNYKERFDNPRVIITYVSLAKSFNIKFRDGQSTIVYDYNCESHLIENEIDKMKNWVSNID